MLVFLIGSLLCWFAIRISSSRNLAKTMGDQYLQNRTLCVLATEEQALTASRMGKLMHSVSKNVPWESKCLTDALCVKWLLNRYRIPAVFYLGAKIDSAGDSAGDSTDDSTEDTGSSKNDSGSSKNSMQAHAWVSVGPYVVTGAPEHLDFQVVATFASPVLEPAHL